MRDTNPYLSGSFAPIDDERRVEHEELEVIGELPRELYGSYLRNGPNPRFTPHGLHHWFDGDGMVHALRFENGRATYQNRYIHTKWFERETQAGKGLFTGLMEPVVNNPKGAPYKDTSNTDICAFRGKAQTSWYMSGAPYELDPATLSTEGPLRYGADTPLKFSAHPKVDPRTGALHFFDYGPVAPFMRYGVISPAGELTHLTDIALPGPRFPHDMALSEKHVILMDPPLRVSPKAQRAGRWGLELPADAPMRFGVLPQHGRGDSVRWFEVEPCYVYHSINAWEDGDEVVLVGCRVMNPLPAIDPDNGVYAVMMANLQITAELYEWRFNMKTGETRGRTVDDRNTEFPSMNVQQMGRPTRFSYNVRIAPTPTLRFDAVVKYDTQTGEAATHEFGPGRYGSEAPFAPSDAARAGLADHEDEGYVTSFVHDEGTGRSEVVVLNARDVAAGPVARVMLPRRVPLGFHACWVPGAP
jgi:carotenoid cleavage dioxygenase